MAIGSMDIELQLDTAGMVAALRESQENLAQIGRETQRQMAIVRAEFGAATARMDENTDATERLQVQNESLGHRLEQQRRYLDALNQTYQQSVAVNGENSEATQRLAVRLARAQEVEANLERQIRDTTRQLNEQSDASEESGRSWSGMAEKLGSVGEKMSTFISIPIAGFLALATEGTKELRKELAILETNAEMAGASLEKVNEAYRTINGVRDDLAANSETINELLASGFKGDDLQKALEGVIGAGIKFNQTLNFEGIADGLQETLGTSAAAGSFLELLERMGQSVDEFNAGLVAAKANGTELQYVLDTMAKLGLTDTYNAYLKNNQAMVDGAKATYDIQKAMADLGKTIEPIITKLTAGLASLVGWFTQLPTPVQNTALVFAILAAAMGPVLFMLAQLITVIPTVTGLFTTLAGLSITGTLLTGLRFIALMITSFASVILPQLGAVFTAVFTGITWPIVAVAAAIAGLIYLGYEIIKNWESVKQFFVDFATAIMEIFPSLGELFSKTLPEQFNGFINWFAELPGKIGKYLDEMVKNIPYSIGYAMGAAVKLLADTGEKIIQWFKDLPGNIADSMIEFKNTVVKAAQELAIETLNYIQELPGKIKDYFSEMVRSAIQSGKDFVNGFIENIKQLPQRIEEYFMNILDKIINFIPNLIEKAKQMGREFIRGFKEGLTGGEIKVNVGVASGAKLPGLASGGTLTSAGSVVVGEYGPEILNLPRAASVTPLDVKSGQTASADIDYNLMATAIAQALTGAKFVTDINTGTVKMIVGGILRREVRS